MKQTDQGHYFQLCNWLNPESDFDWPGNLNIVSDKNPGPENSCACCLRSRLCLQGWCSCCCCKIINGESIKTIDKELSWKRLVFCPVSSRQDPFTSPPSFLEWYEHPQMKAQFIHLFNYWRLTAQSTAQGHLRAFHKFILFIYWRLTAQSTAQGHLRAFHKLKYHTSWIH